MSLFRDFAYGARTLRKNPGFTITAMVTLALGIGATTAIFSVVNAVLLRPLPYPDADRLVVITSDMTARNVQDFPMAAGDVANMRDGGSLFADIAAVQSFDLPTVDEKGETQVLHAAAVSTNLFRTLGARMVAGRDFTDADGTPPPRNVGANGVAAPPAAPPPPPTVILGYGYWQRHFGGDRKVIGTVVTVGQVRGEVVGVAPRGFTLLFPPDFRVNAAPDVYLAARVDWATGSHINVGWRTVGLLKPGVNVGEAQSQMNTVAADLNKQVPIKATAGFRLRVEPMRAELVSGVRAAVLALMGGVTFVLLIACANVANLLLVRASRRERELAVRAALGGKRSQLVVQMLAEALLLSLGGALLGIGLAELGVKLLVAIGPQDLPTIGRVSIDPAVLGFTITAGVAAAVLFGVVPALRASRPDIVRVLRSSSRTSELGGGRRLRNGVVIAEVSLAFVLLVGSGLMLRSFASLTRADPGIDPDGLLTFRVQPPPARDPQATAAFTELMRQRLSGLPGVTGVTAASGLPFSGRVGLCRWGTEAAVNDPAAFQQADFQVVVPGYFKVIRTKVIAGRTFTDADNAFTSTAVVIDRVLAQKAFPGRPAVGQRLYVRYRSDTPEWVDVIGVVDQERQTSPAVDGREQIYFVDGQFNFGLANTFVVRTAGDPARLESSVRAEVAKINAQVPVMDMRPMSAYVADARKPTRFALALIAAFAAIALVLAAVGLYGVLSTIVRQRTAEIGVRMAFGAPKARIFRQMIGEGMRLSGVGIGLGLLAAFALTRVMRSMLVGVRPTDPGTFAAIAVLFVAIAAVSCWLPARRAAALDPVDALRAE
ncbi:MAG TPA: ABC transporter permease [Gemmatimonadaceae bacterium]